MKISSSWLALPGADALSCHDSYGMSLFHANVIRTKPFLKNIYLDFYARFKASCACERQGARLVEIGSGGGFIKEILPDVITSDILPLPHVDICFSALQMPFCDSSVDAFFLIDVLHHMHNPRMFFKELTRCLKSSGKVIMVEPANTVWSRFIYRYFHHEPFDCSLGWGFPEGDPLFAANSAIPWIIFQRDKNRFLQEFPGLTITRVKPHTPFRYLASGGVSKKQLVPTCAYPVVRGMETVLSPFNKFLGMFLTIEVEKSRRPHDTKNQKNIEK